MSVSRETREEVCDRDGFFPDGRDYHHIFYKSEFFHDIDGAWNGVAAKRMVHTCIHSPGTDNDAAYGHQMEILYKEGALERYVKKYPSEKKSIALLEQIIKRKKIRYGL